MSSRNRRKKQVSLYLEGWLKQMAEEKSLGEGETLTAYIRGLIKNDLGLEVEYKPKEVTITYLPDGTTIYGLNEEVVGGNE